MLTTSTTLFVHPEMEVKQMEGITFSSPLDYTCIEKKIAEINKPLNLPSFPKVEKFRIPASLVLDDGTSLRCVIKGY